MRTPQGICAALSTAWVAANSARQAVRRAVRWAQFLDGLFEAIIGGDTVCLAALHRLEVGQDDA
jgi:hypothetical protein